MWDLFKNHNHEVGSAFPEDRRNGRSVTDCITYVKNVLIYGHDKINRPDISNNIRNTGIPMGKMLALYLIKLGWTGHYWNPDVRNPRKGDSEHSASYRNMVIAKKQYYEIPISGVIIDYNKEVKTPHKVWVSTPIPIPGIGTFPIPTGSIETTGDNLAILEKLSKVKFAYGISRGGEHTWLFSFGEVFEVHWAEEGTRLYGKKALKDYNWFSGALFTPVDSTFTSNKIPEK